jgi:hypothetical protein
MHKSCACKSTNACALVRTIHKWTPHCSFSHASSAIALDSVGLRLCLYLSLSLFFLPYPGPTPVATTPCGTWSRVSGWCLPSRSDSTGQKCSGSKTRSLSPAFRILRSPKRCTRSFERERYTFECLCLSACSRGPAKGVGRGEEGEEGWRVVAMVLRFSLRRLGGGLATVVVRRLWFDGCLSTTHTHTHTHKKTHTHTHTHTAFHVKYTFRVCVGGGGKKTGRVQERSEVESIERRNPRCWSLRSLLS